MDDLLDLNWTTPASPRVNQPTPKPQKPKDAFADLLSTTTPKPVDTSKLSLLEQQQLQQQQRQQSTHGSPWLTPTQATTPLSSTPKPSTPMSTTPLTATPVSSGPRNTQSSLSFEAKQSSTSSFEDLLNPFGNNTKIAEQGRNTPLNQIRSQTSSRAESVNSSQWDFDLLDAKLNNNTTRSRAETPSNNTHTPSIDPFDMDSLVQESKSFSSSPKLSVDNNEEEDDNPLGILAEPAPQQQKQETPSPPAVHHSPTHQQTNFLLSEEDEDAMMAQLIDMGFSLQESKFAIEATGGNDLQAAVDLLVQNSEIVQRRQPSTNQNTPKQQHAELSHNDRARRALFSEEDISSSTTTRPRQQQQQQRKEPTQPPSTEALQQQTEKIVNQAQELGGFLYKNATSFLKTGREKVTKAVGDWQEQQRTTRMNQAKEEQGGPIRPKWMTDGDDTVQIDNQHMEKFADDEDSDHEEQDMEAERRKIQEMRRVQEMKQREAAAAAHKARQQQNLRRETLIKEEEIYISPSRRRGNTPGSSGKSTPQSSGSPIQQQRSIPPQQQQQQNIPKEKKRTRPIINASPDVMSKVNEARNQGNEKFKLGQFGEAEEAYTRAIDILPSGHDHLVLLSNNRAMTRLKNGNYKKCVEDCDVAIALAKESGDGSINSEGIVIQWRDQIMKSLYRKAEAFENIEKYKDALSTYDELIKLEGTNNSKINQGMSRCRQALNPKKVSTPKKTSTSPPPQQEKKQDFMSMFDPSATSSPSTNTVKVSNEELSKSKAVAAIRAKAAEQEAEDAEKLEKTDDVNARLVAWKAGKEQNLRALLATLDTLLWPGAQWKGAQMSELINPKKCKITYMKAIGKVHPDKLPSNVTVEQRMLASGIFASLNEAWDAFKGQNQM